MHEVFRRGTKIAVEREETGIQARALERTSRSSSVPLAARVWPIGTGTRSCRRLVVAPQSGVDVHNDQTSAATVSAVPRLRQSFRRVVVMAEDDSADCRRCGGLDGGISVEDWTSY